MTSKTNPNLSDLLAQVNDRGSEHAAGSDVGSQIWLFHCECGAADCEERVSMTVAEYSDLKLADARAPVLAVGHRRSLTHKTREWAVSLREEAAALRAQARHQANRATRLRRKP